MDWSWNTKNECQYVLPNLRGQCKLWKEVTLLTWCGLHLLPSFLINFFMDVDKKEAKDQIPHPRTLGTFFATPFFCHSLGSVQKCGKLVSSNPCLTPGLSWGRGLGQCHLLAYQLSLKTLAFGLACPDSHYLLLHWWEGPPGYNGAAGLGR